MERVSSTRHRRNTQERDRRMRMKDLYSKLASLLPPQPTRLTVPELVAQATCHIKDLKERIEGEKLRKAAIRENRRDHNHDRMNSSSSSSSLPILDIRSGGSTLELNMITGLNKNFMIHEVISVLEEEGAEVVNVALHNSADKTIYVIKSQAFCSRVGINISRIQERLQDLMLCLPEDEFLEY